MRVWVAGCATGEEAYSIAMIILECLDELQKNLPVQIYATDIDTDALNIARAGIYPADIAAHVSQRTPEALLYQTGKFVSGKEKSKGNGGLCPTRLYQGRSLLQDGPHLLPQSPYLPGKRYPEKAAAAFALCYQAWRPSLFRAL